MNVHAVATVLADGEPRLERDIFGTADARRIVRRVDRFCRDQLGVAIRRYEFFFTSVGSVHGVQLCDGRRVVVKVYRQGVDQAHLLAAQRVQAGLADAGFPAPRPLLGPAPLAQGIAIVELVLDQGGRADAHDPTVRLQVARGLWRLIEQARPFSTAPGLASWREGYDRLWREPHDARFDFERTAAGVAWIDRLAARAKRQIDRHALPAVVGHSDWRVEHLRFTGGSLTAVYDWDSLSVGPEPVFVGAAAHSFTADWSIPGHRCLPTIEESLGFLADYEAARCTPFDAREHEVALASLVATTAYSARCEHSDNPTKPHPDGFLSKLAHDGQRLLEQARC